MADVVVEEDEGEVEVDAGVEVAAFPAAVVEAVLVVEVEAFRVLPEAAVVVDSPGLLEVEEDSRVEVVAIRGHRVVAAMVAAVVVCLARQVVVAAAVSGAVARDLRNCPRAVLRVQAADVHRRAHRSGRLNVREVEIVRRSGAVVRRNFPRVIDPELVALVLPVPRSRLLDQALALRGGRVHSPASARAGETSAISSA